MRVPRVSVCIPVYNGARYLAQSIASVLGQTYEDFELVVSDNGSTDSTPEVVRAFDDPRVRYLRNESNIGVVGNFNRCIALARADYVCIWHHDDVMRPDNLARKVKVLDGHPQVGFVHSNIERIDADGRVFGEHWHPDSRRDYVDAGLEFLRRQFGAETLACAPSMIVRRSAYVRLGGYRADLPYCCDVELAMRLSLFYDVACIGRPLIAYRMYGESASGACSVVRAYRQEAWARRVILATYAHLLPDGAALRRRANDALADRALRHAYRAHRAGDRTTARRCLWTAATLSPRILSQRDFWVTAVAVAAAPLATAVRRRPPSALGS
jgi:glycosyltransferase involved in cell wall biosynthesis